MKHLVRDGVKLFYTDEGRGNPPIVLVHGWTCDHSYFEPQRKHLSKRHRVITVDLRGHGRSDKPKQEYSISGFADDIAWLCEQLKVKKPVVIGHSMGGMIALEVASRHPDLPAAIVACDSPVVVPRGLKANFAAMLAQLGTPDFAATQRGLIETMFIEGHDPKLKARIIKEMTSAPEHISHECMRAIISMNSERAARRCKVPFLHIFATNPLGDSVRLKKLCPTATIAQTYGAGHFHQLEVPDQVNAMIDRFVRLAV